MVKAGHFERNGHEAGHVGAGLRVGAEAELVSGEISGLREVAVEHEVAPAAELHRRCGHVGEFDIAIGGSAGAVDQEVESLAALSWQCPRSQASLRILKLPGRRIHADGTDEHLVQTPPVGKAALLGDCLETERGVAQKQLLGAAHPAFG